MTAIACVSDQCKRLSEPVLIQIILFKRALEAAFNDPVTVIQRQTFTQIYNSDSVVVLQATL